MPSSESLYGSFATDRQEASQPCVHAKASVACPRQQRSAVDAVKEVHRLIGRGYTAWLSRPCIGLAPGPNGSPLRRPSGVFPVALPYTTFEVMVSTLWVCVALR